MRESFVFGGILVALAFMAVLLNFTQQVRPLTHPCRVVQYQGHQYPGNGCPR